MAKEVAALKNKVIVKKKTNILPIKQCSKIEGIYSTVFNLAIPNKVAS